MPARVWASPELKRLLERVKRAEIAPEELPRAYVVDKLMREYPEALGFDGCLEEALMRLRMVERRGRRVMVPRELFEAFKASGNASNSEGLGRVVVGEAFRIFLKRLISLIAGIYGEKTPDKDPLINAVERAMRLPAPKACELIRERVERAGGEERPRGALVKLILLLGLKASYLWRYRYGLYVGEPLSPENRAEGRADILGEPAETASRSFK